MSTHVEMKDGIPAAVRPRPSANAIPPPAGLPKIGDYVYLRLQVRGYDQWAGPGIVDCWVMPVDAKGREQRTRGKSAAFPISPDLLLDPKTASEARAEDAR